MSFSHLLILGIIAVLVVPPDKLPEVARQIAKFIGEMRRMSSGIFDDLNQPPKLKPEDMLKRQQQKEQEQNAESVQPDPNLQPELPIQPIELTPEEKKKSEDDYLKFIQGETAPATEQKKLKDE